MNLYHLRYTWATYLSRLARYRARILLLVPCCIFILILHFILKWEGESRETTFAHLDIDIPEDFQPVLITQREEFPSSGPSRIPKIIHQTWKDKHIPQSFVEWIKTWLQHHPGWEYWLWTDDSAGQLIADKYPHLLDTYFGYVQPIRRADALRYVVLYEYGGIYADMDMEVLTPLDPLTFKYSCFIGQEPFEHPIMDTNFEQLIINAVIGCKKDHPFMKMLIDNLPAYFHMWDFLDSTGPHYVTAMYHKYLKESADSFESYDSLYIAPSEYFYPKIDPEKISYMWSKCQKVSSLSRLQMKACRNLKAKYSQNNYNAMSVAFTNHHWYHTYLTSEFSFSYRYTDIHEIAPSVKIYGSGETETT